MRAGCSMTASEAAQQWMTGGQRLTYRPWSSCQHDINRTYRLPCCTVVIPSSLFLCRLSTCSPDIKLPSPTDLIDTVRDIVKQEGLTLVIEPGRSMVATSCALVNTVTGGCW
jgi:hypothetical protein